MAGITNSELDAIYKLIVKKSQRLHRSSNDPNKAGYYTGSASHKDGSQRHDGNEVIADEILKIQSDITSLQNTITQQQQQNKLLIAWQQYQGKLGHTDGEKGSDLTQARIESLKHKTEMYNNILCTVFSMVRLEHSRTPLMSTSSQRKLESQNKNPDTTVNSMITHLSISASENLYWDLKETVEILDKEGNTQGFLSLLRPYNLWRTARDKTFQHFTSNYPSIATQQDEQVLQLTHPIKTCTFKIEWKFKVTDPYMLVPDLQLSILLPSRDKHKKYEHAAMRDMRLVDFGKFTNQNVNANDTLCGPCLYEMRKEEATNFCIECMQYMCRSCKVYHMKFDLPIKHTVIHVRDMDLDEFKSFVPCYDNEVHYKELFDKQPPARTGLPYKPPLQQLQAHKTVSTKICEDLQHPNITGIAFCRRGQLLLCDHNNRRLKLFSTEFIPLSHIDLGEIADVAVLNDSNAVITLPEKKQLLFVSIHGDSKLIQNKKIATIGHYWGIEYVNEELFALSMSDTISQATVHILSSSGNILSVIHPSLGHDYNFSLNNSKYLAVSPSGGTIYVADAEIGVIAVGLDGRIILNHYDDDLDNARGIVVDAMSVYVCSRDTNRVVQLSHDGSLSSVLLGQSDNLVQPCCIAMDTPGKKMIISMADVVKVYVYS